MKAKWRCRHALYIVTTVLAVFWTTPSLSLELDIIERYDNGAPKKIRMSGEIQSGDYDRFVSFVQKNPSEALLGLNLIELSSNGGNVVEAMKIASKLKQFYPSIWVKDTCASSCLLLWLSGSYRTTARTTDSDGRILVGRIGVHRPTLPAEDLEKIPLTQLDDRFKKFNTIFKEFVLEQGLPVSIYEKLLATDSGKIYWLSNADLQLIGKSPLYVSEKERAVCGKKFERYLATDAESDKEIYAKCFYSLADKERITAIDSILGKNKNQKWEKFKQRILANAR